MTSLVVPITQTGQAFTTKVKTVFVHTGRRGLEGVPGEKGDQGDPGDSIVSRGAWVSGFEYCPLDMVTAPSSTGVGGVTSAFIQKSTVECSVSTASPETDPARWDEVGYTDFGDALGNIWEVNQTAHNFTMIGTGVQFDGVNGLWILSDPANEDTMPFAVVREIPGPDQVILQSTGLLIEPDDGLTTDGPWVNDTIYYARAAGLVAKTPPGSGEVVPILRYLDGDAVVFPNQSLGLVPPPNPAPAPATTIIKLDSISFDGITLQFPLLSGAAAVPFGPAESFTIVMDGHIQEPLVDFSIVDNGGDAEILFPGAPAADVTFWGVYAV